MANMKGVTELQKEQARAIFEATQYDYQVRSYSGRGMYGEECIAVSLASAANLWDLAQTVFGEAEVHNIIIPTPHIDQLGRGVIAYWPNLPWLDEFGDGDDEEDS